jgi:hypothetical protein
MRLQTEHVIAGAIFAGMIAIVLVGGKKGDGDGHGDRDYASDSWDSDGGGGGD